MKPFGRSSLRGVLVEIKLVSGVSRLKFISTAQWVEDHRRLVQHSFVVVASPSEFLVRRRRCRCRDIFICLQQFVVRLKKYEKYHFFLF